MAGTPAAIPAMPASRFDGRTVLVTGGAQGMGAAHCRGFHAEGANVVVADVKVESGRAVADELGDRALFVDLDVTQPERWAAAVAIAEEAFGSLSVLVNNAATIEPEMTLIEHFDPAAWRRIVDVNLVGTMLGIRAVAPSIRAAAGGSIINISSVGGYGATPGHSAYDASKWAIRGLTKVAALELGRYNIRVNSVHPGFTNTQMHAQAGSPLAGVKRPDRYLTLAIPRVAEPDEVTRMVLFLASDDAGYSTGAEFIVDGGFLLGPALPPDPIPSASA